MIFRIIRIMALMSAHVLGYALAGLRGKRAADRYLLWAYLGWARYVLKTFDAVLEVRGKEHIPSQRDQALVILSNHQSQLDIPALVASLNGFMGFVAKRELTRIPLLAFWMRKVGCVFIDRGNRSEAQRTLNEAAASLGPHPIVVFPEGTRSKTGELLPFKPGGARLAVMAKAMVLPVRIDATRNAFEARAKGKPPFAVTVTFFPVLDTRSLSSDNRTALDEVRLHVESCWRSQVFVK